VSAPCAAADECHGADSSPPLPPTVASATSLGATGNVIAEKKAKHRKAKHRKAKHKKKKAHGRRSRR
jgi:hypothetical protein